MCENHRFFSYLCYTMLNIENFIDEIIPPSDYQHRDGFSNTQSIDKLDEQEKKLVEDALICRFSTDDPDTLIIDTLLYLRSEKAIPLFYDALQISSSAMIKLIIGTSIYELNKDADMINTCILSVGELEKNRAYYMYNLPTAFYYLAKTHNEKLNLLIGKYVNHKEYLISYNAKRHFRRNP